MKFLIFINLIFFFSSCEKNEENNKDLISESVHYQDSTFTNTKSDTLEKRKSNNNILNQTNKKIISYNNDTLRGIIFTKEYFNNSKNYFTPTLKQINEAEDEIGKLEENFDDYYRQYDGRVIKGKKHIIMQLIPKQLAENDYPNWKDNYIYVQDEIRFRYIEYDINTHKISVQPMDDFGG